MEWVSSYKETWSGVYSCKETDGVGSIITRKYGFGSVVTRKRDGVWSVVTWKRDGVGSVVTRKKR